MGCLNVKAKRIGDGLQLARWIIHRIERTISASKTSRRKQEEWMVCNYSTTGNQATLF